MVRIFKLNRSEAIKSAPVLNLSSYALTNDEVQLLAKGLNFIPKPPKVDKEEIEKSIDQFKRRIKLTEYMRHYEKKEQKPFYDKSNFDPPDSLIYDKLEIPETIEKLRSNFILKT